MSRPFRRVGGSSIGWIFVSTGQSLSVGQGSAGYSSTVAPSGALALLDSTPTWRKSNEVITVGAQRTWSPSNGCIYTATAGGTTAATSPTPSTTLSATFTDGTVTWQVTATSGGTPYDLTHPTSTTLSLGPLVAPENGNTTSNVIQYYPQNIIGEGPIPAFVYALRNANTVLAAVGASVGQGGSGLSVIGKGGTGNAYAAGLYATTAATRLLSATGYRPTVGAVLLTHGEADAVMTPGQYSDGVLSSIWSPWQTDLTAITGQGASIPLLMSQEAGYEGYLNWKASGSSQGMLDLATTHAGSAFVFPKYQLEYNSDGVHLSSYRRLGEYYAKAWAAWFTGSPLTTFRPTLVSTSGTTCTITYAVPVGSLQVDGNLPLPYQTGDFSDTTLGGTGKGWTSGKGHGAWDNGGIIGIHSAVVSGNTVTLTLDRTPGAGFYLQYAMAIRNTSSSSAPIGTGNSRVIGPLCDQDTTVAYDQESFGCTVTNGSAVITAGAAVNIDVRRAVYDVVSGSGLAAGTVAIGRPGSGQFTLSNPWTGSTGAATLTFRSSLTNYACSWLYQVTAVTVDYVTPVLQASPGSTARAHGSGFIDGALVQYATGGGGAILGTLSYSWESANTIALTNVPSLATGSYDLVITNPLQNAARFTNAITATATDDYLQVMGADAILVLRPDATAYLKDSSGYEWSTSTVSGTPSYTANDSLANNQPTASLTAGIMKVPSFLLDNGVGGVPYYVRLVARVASAPNTLTTLVAWATQRLKIQQSSGAAYAGFGSDAGPWTGGPSIAGLGTRTIEGSTTGIGGSSTVQSITINGEPATTITQTSDATPTTTNDLGIGGIADGSQSGPMVVASMMVCRVIPTSTQLSRLIAIDQAKWNVLQPYLITPPVDCARGGQTVIIKGFQFSYGSTPTVTIGGVSCTSVTVVDDQTITCVTPTTLTASSTAYNVVVTTGHGTFTMANAFWVIPNMSAWYFGGAGFTLDGSNKVTAWADRSGNGYNLALQLGSPQTPTANFNSTKYGALHMSGNRFTATVPLISQPYTWFVVAQSVIPGDRQCVVASNDSTNRALLLQNDAAGNAFQYYAGGSEPSSAVGHNLTSASVLGAVFHDASSVLQQNGTTIISGTSPGTNGMQNISLGDINGTAATMYEFSGDIAFFGVYPGDAVSDSVMSEITTTLRTIYGT